LSVPSPVFLTVRYTSARLPGKCLRKIGGLSVLEHLIRRLQITGLTPIICTSTDLSDDIIIDEANRLQVKYFRGSLLNKIQRWSDCASKFGFSYAHILDADDPFFDTEEVIESIAQFQNLGIDLLKTSKRSDSGFASVGMSISADFLSVLAMRTKKLASSDLDVIPWALITSNLDKIRIKSDNVLINQEIELRLTLDYPEDLDLLDILAKKFGPLGKRIDIENYLVDNVELRKLNAHRTSDFLKNKSLSLEENFGITRY